MLFAGGAGGVEDGSTNAEFGLQRSPSNSNGGPVQGFSSSLPVEAKREHAFSGAPSDVNSANPGPRSGRDRSRALKERQEVEDQK